MKFGAGISRRSALQLCAATLLAACSPAQQASTPSSAVARGNTLRLGIGGAATTDSLDPATYADTFSINVGRQIMNGLVEYDDAGHVAPALFESWDAKPGAASWNFRVRSGVEFHNGKTLAADDVVYSINRHRHNPQSTAGYLLDLIKDVRVVDGDQVAVDLLEGNADLLHYLSDFHLLVVPEGFTDWRRPIGTGAFRFESFEPGVRAITIRQANYWKGEGARVDAVETVALNAEDARIGALLDGEVDSINRISPARAGQIAESPGVGLKRTPGRYHANIAMQIDAAPFDSIHVRRALKYGIDRQAILGLLHGFGSLANDHPIAPVDPNFNTELVQTTYDPDMARHHLKKAGFDSLKLQLTASEGAFIGAANFAKAFAGSAGKAGIEIDVAMTGARTFWNERWMKTPFFASYWGGRPAATQMFDVAYRSVAGWNETKWRNSAFDSLLVSAKTELDQEKRRRYLWEMQAMLQTDGGMIIPAFRDWIDAASDRVQGYTMGGPFDLCDGRIAERVWLSS
jgi:peptide/nickel transport system substrate-binding protein